MLRDSLSIAFAINCALANFGVSPGRRSGVHIIDDRKISPQGDYLALLY